MRRCALLALAAFCSPVPLVAAMLVSLTLCGPARVPARAVWPCACSAERPAGARQAGQARGPAGLAAHRCSTRARRTGARRQDALHRVAMIHSRCSVRPCACVPPRCFCCAAPRAVLVSSLNATQYLQQLAANPQQAANVAAVLVYNGGAPRVRQPAPPVVPHRPPVHPFTRCVCHHIACPHAAVPASASVATTFPMGSDYAIYTGSGGQPSQYVWNPFGTGMGTTWLPVSGADRRRSARPSSATGPALGVPVSGGRVGGVTPRLLRVHSCCPCAALAWRADPCLPPDGQHGAERAVARRVQLPEREALSWPTCNAPLPPRRLAHTRPG